MVRKIIALSWAVWSCLVAGCGARDCRETEPSSNDAEDTRRLYSALSRAADTPKELHVLVLSGGGSYGAFGAGLLRGWRTAREPRPDFSIVTGVSTGALLATHAFTGTLEDDVTLENVYTTVTNGDIFSKRWFFTLPFSNSIATLAPLERLIGRFVTDTVIDRVGTIGLAGHRRLYVATTNLDEGRLKIWDLTAIAAARQYDKYRAVLLASSAVPGLYPPVEINGALHSDGGVREQLFIRDLMFEVERARGDRAGADVPPATSIHVVVNGKLTVDPACLRNSLLPLALRGVEVLTAAAAYGNLLQSRVLADSIGATWRMARIPEAMELSIGPQDFDPEAMRLIYDAGRTAGAAGRWESDVPSVVDAKRAISRPRP